MNKIKKVISDFFLEESGFIEKKKVLLLGFFSTLAGLNSQSVHARTEWNPDDAPIRMCKIDDTTVGVELDDSYCNDADNTETFTIDKFPLSELKKILGLPDLEGVNFVAPPDAILECSSHMSSDCCHESTHFSCHEELDFGTEVNHKNALELSNTGSELEAKHTHSAPSRSFSKIKIVINDHCSGWSDDDHINTCQHHDTSSKNTDLSGSF